VRVGIPTEIHPGEKRVAATPESVKRLIALGFQVRVQAGAGRAASYPDEGYAQAGAEVVEGAEAVWGESDLVLKVRPPAHDPATGRHEAEMLREGAGLVSFIWPAQNKELLERLAARKATVLAMDCVPRITRAQKMDALSSMANIAGYRAVVEAAAEFGSFFTGQMTAAGKVPPAKVLIIGAGVAGLAAIAAARGLGAVVRAFDTRPAVKEQVQSLGAEFLEVHMEESGEGQGGYAKEMSEEFLAKERALFLEQAREIDIVVTTALIPGKKAPLLWNKAMVEAMRPGSVIVDLAAEQGGNCELTRAGERVEHHGVRILGYPDLTCRLPTVASQLYATNLVNLLDEAKGAQWNIDLDDEVLRGALVTHEGEITWPPPPPPKVEAPKPAPVKAAPAPVAKPEAPAAVAKPKKGVVGEVTALVLFAGWLVAKLTVTGDASPETIGLLQHLTVFVLACFVGWQIIWNVTPALHTPLMSVTNAISGIIVIGGMLHAHGSWTAAATLLGVAAILLATINVAGGFLVTQRMLRMFRK
jgi:NAD(P) transhydrogenase subunit alpha